MILHIALKFMVNNEMVVEFKSLKSEVGINDLRVFHNMSLLSVIPSIE